MVKGSIKTAQTLHEIRDTEKLQAIVSSMSVNGWVGRPVLVLDCGDHYEAFTGSHRIHAAIATETMIEALIIEDEDWNFDAQDDMDMANDDHERMAVLQAYGLKKAAELMQQEINANS